MRVYGRIRKSGLLFFLLKKKKKEQKKTIDNRTLGTSQNSLKRDEGSTFNFGPGAATASCKVHDDENARRPFHQQP